MPFCVNCGKQLSDNAKFCAYCGTPMASIPVMPEEPVVAAPVFPVTEEPSAVEMPVVVPVEIPVAEEPEAPVQVFQETAPEAPVYQEPAYQAPVYQEPVYQEPVYQEPVYQAPAYQEPVYQAPVAAAEGEKVEKVRLFQKKPLGIGKRILLVFLCMLTFIFGTATVAALCLRSAVSSEKIVEIIELVDLSEFQADTIIDDAKKDDSMSDWLHEQLVKRNVAWAKMSTKDVQVYLEKFVMPFVKDQAGDFAKVLLTGKGKAEITTDDIRELLQDSADYLQKEHDVQLTKHMVDDLVFWLDSFGITEMANTKYLENQFGQELEIIRMVLSWAAVAVFGALTALFVIFILLTNKCFLRNLNTVGGLMVAEGILFGALCVINLFLPDVLLLICGGIELLASVAGMMISSVYTIELILLGGGIGLLLISGLLQAIKVRKK